MMNEQPPKGGFGIISLIFTPPPTFLSLSRSPSLFPLYFILVIRKMRRKRIEAPDRYHTFCNLSLWAGNKRWNKIVILREGEEKECISNKICGEIRINSNKKEGARR